MTAPELKPCPFCGGPAELIFPHDGDRPYVMCVLNFCSGTQKTAEHAIAAWNRRADLPPTLEQAKALPEIKALVEALQFYADPTLTGYDVCVTDYGLGMERGHILQDDGDMARAALRAIGEGVE